MRSQLVAAATALSLACGIFAATATQATAATRITRHEISAPFSQDDVRLLTLFNRLHVTLVRPHHPYPITHHAPKNSGIVLPEVDLHDLLGLFARLHLRVDSRRRSHHTVRHGAATNAGVSASMLELLDLINAERAQAGDGPLHFSSTLDAVAQARSQDMTSRHYFSHQIPGVGYVFNILDRDHVGYQMAGENIALNNYLSVYSMVETMRLTNTDLMNSPEHRANILEPKYSEIGLGMVLDTRTDDLIVTEVFVQP